MQLPNPLSAHLLLIQGHASGRPGGPRTLHLRGKRKENIVFAARLTAQEAQEAPHPSISIQSPRGRLPKPLRPSSFPPFS